MLQKVKHGDSFSVAKNETWGQSLCFIFCMGDRKILVERKTIQERNIYLVGNPQATLWVLQPANGFELEHVDEQVKELNKRTSEDSYFLILFEIQNWNEELSPWEAPAVFGDQNFGAGAVDTLEFLEQKLMPELLQQYGQGQEKLWMIAGYSLAGLFALWCGYQTKQFTYVTAVSPSVWFPEWITYAKEHEMLGKQVYLSLGLKEEKTRNQVMARVGDCIREQEWILSQANVPCKLEWNPGNHFQNGPLRMAIGISSFWG